MLSEIKQLRALTGAGVLSCKRALTEAGSIDGAVELIRAWGLEQAVVREERPTAEGIVVSYVHPPVDGPGRIGVLVEIGTETDFVARTDEVRSLARDVAMQVAATSPATVTDLLAEPWVREPSRLVNELVADCGARTGEHVHVRRFARLEVGVDT